MAIRAKEHELFDDPIILQRVIDSLEADTPITKTEACKQLNIAYNTKRLATIIEEFKDKQERQKRRRKEMRSVPVSDAERKDIIDSYLAGDSLASISESTFRSTAVIKNILNSFNIPLRSPGSSYDDPVLLPDDSYADDYVKDDLVYSAKYDCPAYIRHKISDGIYSMWTVGEYAKQVVQPFYELADLREAQKRLGIKITGMSTEEYNALILEARRNANKRNKK